MEKNNFLTLSSTAYLFHWSNSNFSYSQKEYEHKTKIRKLLQDFSGVSLQYELNSNNLPVVDLNGEKIEVRPHMIKTIYGNYPDCNLINNKNFFNIQKFFETYEKDLNLYVWKYSDNSCTYYSKNFKSFNFEYYKDLQYFRIHFNGNSLDFISSCGKIFEERNGNYKELTNGQFFDRIQAKSEKSRNLIQTLIQAIRNESIM